MIISALKAISNLFLILRTVCNMLIFGLERLDLLLLVNHKKHSFSSSNKDKLLNEVEGNN